ncbi:hypothetical protein [Rhizobium sp. BK399]|uniref:hypothetical protein n=1 Tax=Rhizobium sp. BK399 TaxID=2587063 RepID=UPI0017B60186|nr:hypothetical protein [Rhizobium sp. BK399]MBB3543840.1 hypothetical protein [Rhizobium sp. BK399]
MMLLGRNRPILEAAIGVGQWAVDWTSVDFNKGIIQIGNGNQKPAATETFGVNRAIFIRKEEILKHWPEAAYIGFCPDLRKIVHKPVHRHALDLHVILRGARLRHSRRSLPSGW